MHFSRKTLSGIVVHCNHLSKAPSSSLQNYLVEHEGFLGLLNYVITSPLLFLCFNFVFVP